MKSNFFSNKLGLGDIEDRTIPVLLMKDDLIDSFGLGWFFSVIYRKNGDLLGIGDNGLNQLGQQERVVMRPSIIMRDEEICKVTCNFTLLLVYKRNGELHAFGSKNRRVGVGEEKNDLLKFADIPLTLINGGRRQEWSIDEHKNFPNQFREMIFLLICSLRRNCQNKTLPKIPKFVLFEIVKHCDC